MAANQSLQIFVANGYYDFATPYFATEFAMSHLKNNLPNPLQRRLTAQAV